MYLTRLLPSLLFLLLAPLTNSHPTPITPTLEITRLLSFYAQTIDAKSYAPLTQIFSPNVSVTYPYPPPDDRISSLPQLQEVLERRLRGLQTMHTVSSTVVDFAGGARGEVANSSAYLVASYFGQGKRTGEVLQYFGVYRDSWVRETAGWRIRKRVLERFVSFSFKNDKVRGEQRLLTENLYRVQARLATWASLATRPFKGRVFFHETFYFFHLFLQDAAFACLTMDE